VDAPTTLSDIGNTICHISHIFLFRFRNMLVSHHAVPLTFYNKIALMLDFIIEHLIEFDANSAYLEVHKVSIIKLFQAKNIA